MRTIDIAKTQIGVVEATGNNDGVPAERYNHGDKLAWCAAFVIWCNDKSEDQKIAKSAAQHYTLRSVLAMHLACIENGWTVLEPQENDIVFFKYANGGRHVGIIESIDGDVIATIEGNLGNKVSRARHNRKTDLTINGFARFGGQS